MKNYRVGFKKGGNVTDVSAGPWNKKQKPKPGPKDLEKLKKRKKLKRKKYDLKYSPGPGKGTLEKRFSREQGPGAPPIREQGPGAPPIPSPQDPKVKPDPYRRGWEKLPRSKWKKPIGKFPPEKGKWEKPIGKFPPEKGKWQPMKEGGRTGLKKGGPKPGTYDYFLLHKREKKKEGGRTGLKKGGPKPGTYDYFLLHKKREKKAFGGPSHSVRRAVKKILKKAKAKKDTESVKDVR